ncbi:transmembrane ascorbate-dependent reductase CYB561-like isoform X2 [Prorops nasuta]
MDQIGEPTQNQRLEGFNILLGLTEAVGTILVILVISWINYHRNGLSWGADPDTKFNWHPLLMVVGFVFLYANAMLLYRIQRNVRKRRLKLMHAGLMLFIIVLVIISLVAVFDNHNMKKIPNMYSLHSWVGLTSIILFCCQWVAGCISFLYPGLQGNLRASYMPIHVYFGNAGFIGVLVSCLLGLNEKAIFQLKEKYAQFVGEGVMINIIGIFIIVFGGLTMYLVSQNQYKRLPRPEDDVLLTRTND